MSKIAIKFVKFIYLSGVILIVLVFVFMSMPQSGGAFELTGRFQKMECNGAIQMARGYIPLCTTMFVVDKKEFERVDHYYPRRNFWYTAGSTEGPDILYDRVTTGDWCGELPPKGSKVRVFSLGYTKYLFFLDLQNKRLYKQNC